VRKSKNIRKFKHAGQILLLAVVLFTFGGCGVYSFTGASISSDTRTISIERFPNNAMTVEPTLSQKFTDGLRDKFTRETNLTLLTKGGDLQIEGAITGYRTSPVAIQADETAAMTRLTITVNVNFTNTKDDSQSFNTNFSRYLDYPSQMNLNEVQEALIDEINLMLFQDIFDKSVVNW
jgi:hypothetical protein